MTPCTKPIPHRGSVTDGFQTRPQRVQTTSPGFTGTGTTSGSEASSWEPPCLLAPVLSVLDLGGMDENDGQAAAGPFRQDAPEVVQAVHDLKADRGGQRAAPRLDLRKLDLPVRAHAQQVNALERGAEREAEPAV